MYIYIYIYVCVYVCVCTCVYITCGQPLEVIAFSMAETCYSKISLYLYINLYLYLYVCVYMLIYHLRPSARGDCLANGRDVVLEGGPAALVVWRGARGGELRRVRHEETRRQLVCVPDLVARKRKHDYSRRTFFSFFFIFFKNTTRRLQLKKAAWVRVLWQWPRSTWSAGARTRLG